MLVSDEAPEATCLSNLCGSFRRPVRRFFPLHASLWQGGDGPWNLRSRIDRARVRLRQSHPCGMSARAWPVARGVPAGWCTIPTGTLARGMIVWPFAARLSSPPFSSPRRLGSLRRHGRLVCVPLRHVLPIGVSGSGASDPITFVSSPTSGGRPLQRAGSSGLRQPSTPAPAPPRLTSHRQVYPRAGRGSVYERKNGRG